MLINTKMRGWVEEGLPYDQVMGRLATESREFITDTIKTYRVGAGDAVKPEVESPTVGGSPAPFGPDAPTPPKVKTMVEQVEEMNAARDEEHLTKQKKLSEGLDKGE